MANNKTVLSKQTIYNLLDAFVYRGYNRRSCVMPYITVYNKANPNDKITFDSYLAYKYKSIHKYYHDNILSKNILDKNQLKKLNTNLSKNIENWVFFVVPNDRYGDGITKLFWRTLIEYKTLTYDLNGSKIVVSLKDMNEVISITNWVGNTETFTVQECIDEYLLPKAQSYFLYDKLRACTHVAVDSVVADDFQFSLVLPMLREV